jgi:hypothetical protein
MLLLSFPEARIEFLLGKSVGTHSICQEIRKTICAFYLMNQFRATGAMTIVLLANAWE